MKIVLVVNSMGSGGAERVASTLANAWARRGDVVSLVPTYGKPMESFYCLDPAVKLMSPSGAANTGLSRLFSYATRLKALRDVIRREEPDVVVSFLTNVNVATVLATRGLGLPLIVSEHTNPMADGRSTLWRMLVKWIYPKADAVTLLTEGVISEFRKLVPDARHIAVMPNPLPVELLSTAPLANVQRETKRIIAVGRLQPLKQLDHLISAFAQISSDFENWELWIWGEGPVRKVLEEKIASWGLQGRVFLPGRTAEPWLEMVKADLFVLCSRFEGMPMAMMESMALGLPTVAYDCPSGPRELTSDGQYGWLVTQRNPAALADALREMLSNESLRLEMGRAGAEFVRSHFSVYSCLDRWDRLFAELGIRTRHI